MIDGGKGLGHRAKHEAWTFTLPVNIRSERGPGNRQEGELGSNLSGTSEEYERAGKHQRELHKEVVKEGVRRVEMRTKRGGKERRRGVSAREFYRRRNSARTS